MASQIYIFYACWTQIPALAHTCFVNADEGKVLNIYTDSQASKASSSVRLEFQKVTV